jgi:hypothetical protein
MILDFTNKFKTYFRQFACEVTVINFVKMPIL